MPRNGGDIGGIGGGIEGPIRGCQLQGITITVGGVLFGDGF